MPVLQPARGTRDLLPEAMRAHRHVTEAARTVASRYGYDEMSTPIFEFTRVFARTLGETSDVVSGEMYSLAGRGGGGLTLRPENTAGVARAFVSNGLSHLAPCKFFYAGPMFRRERPQKGRQRQFHQAGIELLGVPEALGDVEVIACGAALLRALGLEGSVALELNTLGDGASRASYREALVSYLSGHRGRLSADSRRRLSRNPLRVLDSKDEGDREVVRNAPVFGDHLNGASADFFRRVTEGLDALSIPYTRNPRLVRGLDYYGHTVFEFTTGALGAQGAVLAGGRYDGLVERMGGPPTPGVGWAAGVERLALLAAGGVPAPGRPVALAPLDAGAERAALGLAESLRRGGLRVEMGYGGPLAKRLRRADRVNARFAVILGGGDLERNLATVRDMDTGGQKKVPIGKLPETLRGDGNARGNGTTEGKNKHAPR